MQKSRLGITAAMVLAGAQAAIAATAAQPEPRRDTSRNFTGRLSEVYRTTPAHNPYRTRRPEGLSARQEKRQAKAARRKHREAVEGGTAG